MMPSPLLSWLCFFEFLPASKVGDSSCPRCPLIVLSTFAVMWEWEFSCGQCSLHHPCNQVVWISSQDRLVSPGRSFSKMGPGQKIPCLTLRGFYGLGPGSKTPTIPCLFCQHHIVCLIQVSVLVWHLLPNWHLCFSCQIQKCQTSPSTWTKEVETSLLEPCQLVHLTGEAIQIW